EGGWLHAGEVCGTYDTAGVGSETYVKRQDVGAGEELSLVGRHLIAGRRGARARAFLTEYQHIHAETTPGLRHQAADRPEPENAERRTAQAIGQGARPVSTPHALGFERDVAARRHDEGDR